MKERILKIGVVLSLVAALVVAGVYPITSQAAAKGTTYNVTIVNGSVTLSLVSINAGAAAPNAASAAGTSFKMVVDSKAKTEKLKTGPASYYPVTILAKSYKSPTVEYTMPGGGVTVKGSVMPKDCVGKLYISGGDVDVTSVQGPKKTTSVIGDGKVDPAGSMIITYSTTSILTLKSTGKVYMNTSSLMYLTTGQSTCIVKGSKSRLEGKVLPTDDTTKTLTKPMVGQPIDLNAGTGTLVGTTGFMNAKNPQIGLLDSLTGQIYVLSITK